MADFAEPFLLSHTGSTRATAYNWGNKIITRDGQTHVVWLDAIATVCGRTYDHESQRWGETVRIAEGCDNHACPCITADAEGHIRLTYGPHGWGADWNDGRVKWMRSAQPGRIDAWEPLGTPQDNFGYNATAASVVHTPSGLDAAVCRGGEYPPQTMFHLQRPKGGWSSAKPLFCQDIEPQYTHHYGHIACATDGTLYAACHFYNVGGGDNHPVTGTRARMRSYGAAVLRSYDLGETWYSLHGERVDVPTTYRHHIAIPPLDRDVYINTITLDTADALWALTLNPNTADDGVWLSRWAGQDWETKRLEGCLVEGRTAVEGMMTFDTRNRLHIVLTTVDRVAVGADSHWGHPSSEIHYLQSSDGGQTFTAAALSPADPGMANWLPSIARSGPYHPIDSPTIAYTHGIAGQGVRPDAETEVWCLRLAE